MATVNTLIHGDCRDVLPTLDAESVQCVVTSPPYWQLRDYGAEGQIGLEPTIELYVAKIVAIFNEVWRVLREDGTLWLVLGDTYIGGGRGGVGLSSALTGGQTSHDESRKARAVVGRRNDSGLPHKNLAGIPWRLALALQADGWILRSDIIWHKPSPMPESVRDRPTKAHEYIFLFAKSQRYFYDADAIAEPASPDHLRRRVNEADSGVGWYKPPSGWDRGPGAHDKKLGRYPRPNDDRSPRTFKNPAGDTRNARTVWTIPSQPMAGAHYAAFPEKLVEPCILAGSRVGDTVLDPFFGSGTVGKVAERLGRRWIGIELNERDRPLAQRRTAQIGLGV